MKARWWRWALLIAVLPIVAALIVGGIAQRQALARLATATQIDARLRQALLLSEIARFRLLPLALAGDRDLLATVMGEESARRLLNVKLETLADTTGAAVIYVLDPQGRAIAASNWHTSGSFIGQDYSFRPYYVEAERRGSASQFGLGTVSRRPGLYLSRRVAGGGVIVVKLEFNRIERQWRQAGGVTLITDAAGVVLVTSRPDWRFATTVPLPADRAARIRIDLQSGAGSLLPLPVRSIASDARQVVVAGTTTPMLQERLAPVDGWQLALIVATSDVERTVRSAQIATVFAMLALIGLVWGIRERSRRRAVQVASAAARTAELQEAVSVRTAELRREMDERIASEARADTLREGLRQANRLATLGQVTASVAHETAQPVAAIRTYAANSERLLERGDNGQVQANLQAIGRLADRIGKVTAELRGFARKGAGAIQPIALQEAIDGAQLILKERLAAIDLRIPDIAPDLLVLAGKVRLEQVLVNLLQNAAEALADQPDAAIKLTINVTDDQVHVDIIDNGPGIDDTVADRIFTPFVTSRASGLGLGLVIALDIMTDMGGTLQLLPSDRGAHFRLSLRRPV
ncbi:histidine kinase [Sphingomonas sp. Leaf339]|nr:histidine kinase [Sphingomonas sp. Leaf339]